MFSLIFRKGFAGRSLETPGLDHVILLHLPSYFLFANTVITSRAGYQLLVSWNPWLGWRSQKSCRNFCETRSIAVISVNWKSMQTIVIAALRNYDVGIVSSQN